MGKNFFLWVLFSVILTLVYGSCAPKDSDTSAGNRPPVYSLLKQYMPAAMKDGIVKIAVVVNLPAGDRSRQFLEGCAAEGRSLGLTIDSFITGADENRCKRIAAGIITADYDGLVFAYDKNYDTIDGASGTGNSYADDILRPIAEQGIPVVSFEVFPRGNGAPPKGITATFQNDELLVRQSLAILVSSSRSGTARPLRIIRIGYEPESSSLARRAGLFNEYIYNGKIVEIALVNLYNTENPNGAVWEGLAAALPRLPLWSADALWAPHEAFAAGCVEALAAAGRKDIKLVSIGLSDEVLHLMQRYPELWLASTVVDPKLAGTVNMRMLAARLAGETVPDTFSFTPQLVKTTDLNSAVTMANIQLMVHGWDDGRGLFDHFQWMDNLKAAEGKYLR